MNRDHKHPKPSSERTHPAEDAPRVFWKPLTVLLALGILIGLVLFSATALQAPGQTVNAGADPAGTKTMTSAGSPHILLAQSVTTTLVRDRVSRPTRPTRPPSRVDTHPSRSTRSDSQHPPRTSR
ncbi:MAG TPA: hypothetical protein VIU33_03770 [Nitrospiria bacterium]